MRFEYETCGVHQVDWAAAEQINAALDELSASRSSGFNVAGIFMTSKLAWKFAILRQALTYRLVDLGEATIGEWNNENFLPSIVLARAFLETVAIVHFVTEQMAHHLGNEDIKALDDLAMHSSFGEKRAEWVNEHGLKATNVLTALDRMAKHLPRVREAYEILSEMAHPNSAGTHQFYTSIERDSSYVSLSRIKRSSSDVFKRINLALTLASWSAVNFKQFDELVVSIADQQARLEPVAAIT